MLSVLLLLAIVFSVFLRFTDSDYPFWYLQTLLSYPIELEIKDTTYAASSVSYRDLHHEIDSKYRLRTKLSHCKLSIIFSNIPAAHAYGVDIYEATKRRVPNE